MISDARAALEKVNQFSDKELKQNFHHMTEATPAEIRENLTSSALNAISMLERAKPLRIASSPIEQLPEYPTRAWIDRNAPTAGLEYEPAPEGCEKVGVEENPARNSGPQPWTSEDGAGSDDGPRMDPQPDGQRYYVRDHAIRREQGTNPERAAMDRMNIEPPFTKAELVRRYDAKWEKANEPERAQLKNDLEALLPLAV